MLRLSLLSVERICLHDTSCNFQTRNASSKHARSAVVCRCNRTFFALDGSVHLVAMSLLYDQKGSCAKQRMQNRQRRTPRWGRNRVANGHYVNELHACVFPNSGIGHVQAGGGGSAPSSASSSTRLEDRGYPSIPCKPGDELL